MLTETQIQEFKENGFLLLNELYNQDEIREIAAWTDEITGYPEIPGKYMMYFEESRLRPGTRILCRMEDIEPYHQGFSRLFTDSRITRCVSDLFCEEAVLFKDKINFKLPGGDGFRAHQDIQAGWDAYSPLHITALLTIDPCTVDNGCLEIAACQHNKGLIGDKWTPLSEDALDYTPLPTDPGDALFFDSYTPHRSGPNMTDNPRRVLYVTYNARSCGDNRRQYYIDKRRNYPPDCERDPDKEYVFRV